MRLENIALNLRRRSPWEALDLGPVMMREWRGAVMRAWAATYFPVALAMTVVLLPWPDAASIAIWWLKPAYDRVLLFAYSRAVFGAAPTLREVYRALPGLLLRTHLLAGLTIHRFSMARSFFLPVWQLEGQGGRAARERRRILGARTRGHAVWLTFVCANLSMILGFSILVLVELMRPVGTESFFDWRIWLRDETPPWAVFFISLAFMVADTVIEPLYVAAGFSLYLNRRTELEGWDIELGFRRLTQRKSLERGPVSRRRGLTLMAHRRRPGG